MKRLEISAVHSYFDMRVLLVYVGVIMRWDIRRKEKKKNTEEDFSITFSPFCRFGAVGCVCWKLSFIQECTE